MNACGVRIFIYLMQRLLHAVLHLPLVFHRVR